MSKIFFIVITLFFFPHFGIYSEGGLEIDPAKLAKAEMETWRDYYQNNAEAIPEDITRMISLQYHVTHNQAWTIIISTLTKALLDFRHLPSDCSADECKEKILPLLVSAYTALKKATNATWDPTKIAEVDLEWWLYRRHADTSNPEIVGKKMSELFRLVYGANDDKHFSRAAYLRAVGARYRDICRHTWQEVLITDWERIQTILEECYKELVLGIKANQKGLSQTN